MKTFKLNKNHLKLLRHMNIQWDDRETGAPSVCPKRPYGNSNVERDVAEILGIEPEKEEDDYKTLSEDQEAYCLRLHSETADALEILIQHARIPTGDYCRDRGDDKWKKVP